MPWDSVPWMVGGGAEHSAEVGRLLAYVAFNGNEGVLGPDDLRVSAQTTPGSSVKVSPGACAILCRSTAQTYQAYAGRMPVTESVSVAATGGTARTDLIVARVEDPWLSGEPWADPANPVTGPYIYTRVISGVPANTTTVAGLNLGYSAIPLARVTIPANTGAITQAMITDLRWVANPRRYHVIDHKQSTANDVLDVQGGTAGTYERFPEGSTVVVDIPSWAVVVRLVGFVEGLRLVKAGGGRMRIGFASSAVGTQPTNINEAAPQGVDRRSYALGGEIAIPASMRGTSQILEVEGTYNDAASKGFLTTDGSTSVMIQAFFEEKAI